MIEDKKRVSQKIILIDKNYYIGVMSYRRWYSKMSESKTELVYTEDSIIENDGPKGVRLRPATLIGNDDIRGCTNAIFEIIANSVDECREGFGNLIQVIYYEDNSVRIKDYGRGVPMGWNEKSNKYNWELVYCTLYASGKGKGTGYSSSEGLNGVGCTVAQYTSDFMIVTSIRDSEDGNRYKYIKKFEEGYAVGDMEVTETLEPTGTEVYFRPSAEVFTDTDVTYDMLVERLRLKAIVVNGLRFELIYKDKEPVSFCYENGMTEFLDISLEDNMGGIISLSGVNERCNDTKDKNPDFDYVGSVNLALAFSLHGCICQMFHNGSILDGGPSQTAVYDSVARLITDEGVKNGKLKKGEKILPRDIDELLSVVCETRCPSDFSKYEHQTKSEINNVSLCKLILSTIREELGMWFVQNSSSFDEILNAAIINKTSRESAERLRAQTLKKITANINRVGNAPDKFLNCTSTKANECEVYIMEGESAKGSIVDSRDRRIQAAMPLRGKITNCLKKPLDAILSEGSVIVDLLTILGCGIELNSKEAKKLKDLPKFNIEKLNFHKIIISTDADVDGGHITCLLLIMLWKLCPSLIRLGYVYLVRAPLFKVQYGTKGEKVKYFYAEEEKNNFVDELKQKKAKNIEVSRFKGLGEMESNDMMETIMNPKSRRLVQIEYPDNEEDLARICYGLMGSDVESRKMWIDAYFNSVEAIIE